MNTDLRIIRIREVVVLTTLTRSTIYKKLRSDKTFPRPVPLSDSNSRGAPVGFVLSEVLAWIESRIEKREGR
ncbi:AlpA family phage regulatory protein [Pseudomonas aeruginosa]|uniref:helix-turn-helix transcriptional regulator n=1 Tax=Pseudomonas aeruginosa TaxID=287 RepID=UPI0031B683FA